MKILNSQVGYNLAASNYDKKEKYLDSFEKSRLLPLLGDIKSLEVLDAGAGTGRLAIKLAELGGIVTALDVSEEMLNILKNKIKRNHKVKTVVGDIESLPFEPGTFDLVISAFVIVHLKNPERFFDEVYRVLKDGGRFLVTNINQKEPPEVETKKEKIKIESYYHRPEKIKEMLEFLAFKIEKEEIVQEGGTWVNQIIVAKK